MARRSRELYESTYQLYRAEADLAYALDVFGDHLAEGNNFPADVTGMEAVNLFLIKKHGWTPAQVREMSPEDKRFALSAEMQSFTIPKYALF